MSDDHKSAMAAGKEFLEFLSAEIAKAKLETEKLIERGADQRSAWNKFSMRVARLQHMHGLTLQLLVDLEIARGLQPMVLPKGAGDA